jgi:protein-S-isoprenylcysteine O-methyltransferase Ste14
MSTKTLLPGIGKQIIIRSLVAPVFLALLIFPSAGTFAYWQGWLFIAINMAVVFLTLFVLRHNPDIINERLKPGQGMLGWDKLYFYLSTPMFFVQLVIAGLDVGRYGWTGPLPAGAYILGLLVFLAGHSLFLWAKATNAYFSSVVRIQTDRGQTVCSTGPYHYVRHPGYVGGLLYMLAGGLILGSLWSILPQLLAAVLLIWRTAKEDALLQAELPGYKAFASQTKYRLLPGVW